VPSEKNLLERKEDIKNRVIQARPQSAKIHGKENNPTPNNDLNNKIAQINQIVRKNIPSERQCSPGKVINPINNNIIKRPNSNNSPRNKSPS